MRFADKGEYIGYGLRKLERPAKLGIVGAGYGHGISRRLSDKGSVLVNGQKCPVVGRICMDFLTVDLTGTEAETGDDVWIIGGGISASDCAKHSGTIDYEIVTALSARNERHSVR